MNFASEISQRTISGVTMTDTVTQMVSLIPHAVAVEELDDCTGGHMIVCYWVSEGFLYRQINAYPSSSQYRQGMNIERWLTDDVNRFIDDGMKVVCPDLIRKIDQEIEDAIYSDFQSAA